MEDFDWTLTGSDRQILPGLVYVHLLKALNRYRGLLEQQKCDGALDHIAWLNRNLLELHIWIEYCSRSPQNSEEFVQDAFRDLNDLQKTVGGISDSDLDTLNRANIFVGNSRPSHKFKDVKAAAQELGLGQRFREEFKLLSKLVHPTAISLIQIQHFDEGTVEEIRNALVESGANTADESAKRLENSILGETYRKFRLAIDAAATELPRHLRQVLNRALAGPPI